MYLSAKKEKNELCQEFIIGTLKTVFESKDYCGHPKIKSKGCFEICMKRHYLMRFEPN